MCSFHASAIAPADGPHRTARWPGLRRFFRHALASLLATFLLTIGLYLPLLMRHLGRIDMVVIDGESRPAAAVTADLTTLFLGTLVMAAGMVSFVLAVVSTPSVPRPVLPRAHAADEAETFLHPVNQGVHHVRLV